MPGAAGLIIGATLCLNPASAEPQFTPDTCRRVALLTPAGEAVSGIEDLALDEGAGLLILSAHDRRAVDHATDHDHPTVPEGGLWQVALERLSDDTVTVAALAPAVPWPNGLRPHGIGLHIIGDTRLLAVVNRGWVRASTADLADRGGGPASGAWEQATAVHILRQDPSTGEKAPWRRVARWDDPALCSANDAMPTHARQAFVTLDRGGCDPATLALEALGGAGGQVLRLDGGRAKGGGRVVRLAQGLRFANGVLVDASRNRLWVAETRGNRLSLYALDEAMRAQDGAELSPHTRVAVDHGPDNLSPGPGGTVIAGGLPDLLGLALYRAGQFSAVASSVMVADTHGGRDILYDARGRMFPGLTGAVLWQQRLIAGSVQEPGLLVCEGKP